MEIVVVLVLLAALIAAVLHAVTADGLRHLPPVQSHSGWGSADLPSRSYSSFASGIATEGR
ncbi:hypothetical protein GC088_01270 [Arthrobacter sp. JZ12]|uniref:hypothetical protein n=1 Tax=Arthrobacter sp. JZ12 TaxID=2654190 RepID=UPI002B4A6F74|nr:hypothetical protein [Arthrobacter sp. JZ12]WRH23883.1 hypothetical protein GC088_01270 [Arthrobacter sp. JZ12]